MGVLLLVRHSVTKLNAQDERLATSSELVTMLHLPLAIVLRLHVRKIDVIILTPEMVGTVDV